MAAQSTALTMSAAAPTKRLSFKVSPQNIIMQQVAQLWQALDATTQGGWQDYADSQTTPTVKGNHAKATAYGQFYIQNSTLLSADAPTITSPPAARTSQPLPPTMLNISYNGSAPMLTLIPNTIYPHSVIIMGAKPLYAGQDIYTKGAFKKIGSVPAINLATDVTNLYLAKYRLPKPGYQVALKLIGVSADGHRTAPLFVAAVALQTGSQSVPILVVE